MPYLFGEALLFLDKKLIPVIHLTSVSFYLGMEDLSSSQTEDKIHCS